MDSRYIEQLGKLLYKKVTESNPITEQDCIDLVKQVAEESAFGGGVNQIQTIYGQLQAILRVKIEPAPDKWDRLYNVDFFIEINGNYIGLQIKPINSGMQLPEIHKEYNLQAQTHKKIYC